MEAEVRLVLDEREDSSLLELCFLVLAGSACRLLHEEEDEEGDDDSGDGGDDEGVTPAVVLADDSADEIAEGRSDGDGDVEDGEDAVALLGRVEVGEERGGEDSEAGLTDAQCGVPEIERVVGGARRR